MSIQIEETQKTEYDEEIDNFALIKARKALFYLACLCYFHKKGKIYSCFDGIASFKHKQCVTRSSYHSN